jgi:hypothetical protein
MKEPTERDLAYIAGYMDGEGCIRAGSKGNLEIKISSTYPDVLYYIQDFFGGTVKREKRSVNHKEHRTAFYFGIYGDAGRRMLLALLPYLQEKQLQALDGIYLKHFDKASPMKEALVESLKRAKRIDYAPEEVSKLTRRTPEEVSELLKKILQ